MRTMYDDPPGRRVPLLLAFELWRQKEAMTTLNSVVREVRPSIENVVYSGIPWYDM